MHFAQEDGITSKVTIEKGDKVGVATSKGNGRLDAVSNALKSYLNVTYRLTVYEERAMGQGSNTTAMSYVGLEKDGKVYWGAGTDDDIIVSSVRALCVAVNKILEE